MGNMGSPNTNFSANSLGIKLMDVLILLTTLLVATSLYGVALSREYLIVLLIVVVSFAYIAEAVSLYRPWRAGTFRVRILLTLATLVCAFLTFSLFTFFFKFSEQLSRVSIALWFTFALFFLCFWRLSLHLYKQNRRKLGFNHKKVAIIGATEAGFKMSGEILLHDELGYDNLGFYDDRASERQLTDKKETIQGSIGEAVQLAKHGSIDVLFIALPFAAEKRIADILLSLGDTTVDVHIVQDHLLANLMHARVDHVGEMNTLSVFESPYHGIQNLIKRTEDIVVSSIILCLIAPVLLTVGMCVKFTSKGPVLFKQDRYGLSGQKIKVWKFRSMSVMENSDVVTQATKGDARITPVGAFIRRTSLDELPQFFNVLLGDMSVVGPRPHAVLHNEEYRSKVDYYMLRHKVKPGITGWAQINGWRGETDTLDKMEKRVEFDLQYIKHWSVWFDIKIIFLTIFKGFIDKNAY
jgi:putative colanic acid biosynthesis UDP-glucose lipid carrier transferase